MKLLAINIKKYRKLANLTQKQLADMLNVAPTAISAWEVGRNKPLMDNIEQMASIFNIRKSELLGELSPSNATLSSRVMIETYEQLNDDNKEATLEYATHLLDAQNNLFRQVQRNRRKNNGKCTTVIRNLSNIEKRTKNDF